MTGYRRFCPWVVVAGAVLTAVAEARCEGESRWAVTGEKKLWHTITITFDGPRTGEDATPNPFTDYWLEVVFANGRHRFAVPGYYAADGRAAETGAAEGDKWRVHFTPEETGTWQWRASFRAGRGVAVAEAGDAGKPIALNGAKGTFVVAESDKRGRDFRGRGVLRYAGGHYLRFAGSGEYFLKGGADSPENFLAYFEFDATPPKHKYQPHRRDWKPPDPTWRSGRGRNIIGALNYLSSQGMNSVYFLTMNVKGDGKDVWPWTDRNERRRFDCSKLDQWDVVFSHMDRVGVVLHVLTQETENDQLLDKGELGPTRRLYYRELIARFAHHPAVVWNLGEENTNTDAQRRAFAAFIRGLDPYDHPIVVHTFPGKYDQVYKPLLGYEHLEGPSLQMGNMRRTHQETKKWVERSAAAGRKWVVCLDEIGPAHTGVKPDDSDPGHDDVRRYALWGNLTAGGAGVEWYFGYKFPHNDLNCEDWRSREAMWSQTRHALEFFRRHLPFVRMKSRDGLIKAAGGYCFAEVGKVYAVYLPAGGTGELKLPAGRYSVQWYNPRRGGALQNGSVGQIAGRGGFVPIGAAPAEAEKDWVALVKRLAEKRTP